MADNQCKYMISETRRCSRNCPEDQSYCWQHENVASTFIKYLYKSKNRKTHKGYASVQTPMYDLINMIGEKEGYTYPEWVIPIHILNDFNALDNDMNLDKNAIQGILNMDLEELSNTYSLFKLPINVEDGKPNDFNDARRYIKG